MLSGLLAHYNSDESDEEETKEDKKLDVKVDNFLQEISDITPVEKPNKNAFKMSWQECFDESTGYPYYWNMETNQVTWDMPVEYKEWLTQSKPSKVTEEVKIIQNKNEKQDKEPEKIKQNNKQVVKRNRKPSSDSEEEKIVMITSYSDQDSESETEKTDEATTTEKSEEQVVKIEEKSEQMLMGPHVEDIPAEIKENTIQKEENKKVIEHLKDENVDETVILSRLRTQAKVLQELDGELPESVNRLLNSYEKKEVTQSLSLVAGYGYGDDSEGEEEPPKNIFHINELIPEPVVSTENSTSTLFPVTQPIDIKQFELPEENNKAQTPAVVVTNTETAVDTKAFKRKKRIAFDVVHAKREKITKENSEPTHTEFESEVRKGFGFTTELESASNKDKPAGLNFKKGGIAFVKSETLLPNVVPPKKDDENRKDKGDNVDKLEALQEVVNEKVNFLCEGKIEVSPVQIMSIQLKTLEAAFKAGGLSEKYFCSWLRETDIELAKLEQEAAPEGWRCQWDRLNKRYYYRNEQTGESQWNYPEQDIIGGGEAMDISTTPPPSQEIEIMHSDPVAPSPPVISDRSPSPPPPPVITTKEIDGAQIKNDELHPPLPPLPLIIETSPPPPPPPSISLLTQEQPLPPGVDSPDLPYLLVTNNEVNAIPEQKPNDSFGSELDSFYSDLALMEATASSTNEILKPQEDIVVQTDLQDVISTTIEVPGKKKKKVKSKIGQGITMKKKAVSSLVEKWKKVQNDYM